jgi:hypothetical protein
MSMQIDKIIASVYSNLKERLDTYINKSGYD